MNALLCEDDTVVVFILDSISTWNKNKYIL